MANTDYSPASNTIDQYGPLAGTTPIAQRSGAVQGSFATSTSTYSTNTTAFLNEVRSTLVALGFWKGGA